MDDAYFIDLKFKGSENLFRKNGNAVFVAFAVADCDSFIPEIRIFDA